MNTDPTEDGAAHPFELWLSVSNHTAVGKHKLLVLEERASSRSASLRKLRQLVQSHYVDPKTVAKRLASLGAPETAKLLGEYLPRAKRARSGDLGEILAVEVAEQHLNYVVPIRRLRWKDGRDMALRGDDFLGVAHEDTRLRILKGESKSRERLSNATLKKAGAALDRDKGRPTRHSVLFVADRLRERGRDELAEGLEKAVLESFRGVRVDHSIFVLTGVEPSGLLRGHLKASSKRAQLRHAVGICIPDYAEFIEEIFGGTEWQSQLSA